MFKKGVFPACFCGRTAYVLAVLLLGIFSARVVCGQNALQTQGMWSQYSVIRVVLFYVLLKELREGNWGRIAFYCSCVVWFG